MIRSRLSAITLGIGIIFVGSTVPAGTASAEAFWLVNGAKITTTLSPSVEVESDIAKTLLTTLGGQSIHVKCLKTELIGAHLTEPEGKGSGKLRYSECDFLSLKPAGGELILQKACEPFLKLGGGVVDKGLIETNSTTVSMGLSESKGIFELKPTEGSGLLTTLNLGEECAFGEQLKVGGVLVLADASGQFSTNLVKHLFEYVKSLTKLTINGGATTAALDGSVWAFLSGAHKGMTWSGQPG